MLKKDKVCRCPLCNKPFCQITEEGYVVLKSLRDGQPYKILIKNIKSDVYCYDCYVKSYRQ